MENQEKINRTVVFRNYREKTEGTTNCIQWKIKVISQKDVFKEDFSVLKEELSFKLYWGVNSRVEEIE